MAVYEMLEFINGYTIRNKLQAACEMVEPVFVGILLEEQIHPRPGKKLHAHRVDLSGLMGREGIFRNLQAAA
ncbi:hypothetical protein D3C75_945630 [compost metagenome]